MQKLLIRFVRDPSAMNAAKLCRYSNAHPMAICMLTQIEAEIMRNAVNQDNWDEWGYCGPVMPDYRAMRA